MVNLVRNENMKIFSRIQTWVMVGILALIVVGFSVVYWVEVVKDVPDDQWRVQLEEQIQNVPEIPDAPISIEQYQLDHDIKPIDMTIWAPMLSLANLTFLITLFVVIVAGDSLAGEFSSGTIKLLLIRPASRSKIMISKYIACILFVLIFLIILFLLSLLTNSILLGFSGWGQPLLELDASGNIVEKSMLLHLWSNYLFGSVSTVMYMTMAFMISAVFRSSAMAIGFSIFTMLFASNLLTLLLGRYEWSKYLLFPNLNLEQHLSGSPYQEGMTMGFSITVLLAYFVIFNLLAWLSFTKRDVAA